MRLSDGALSAVVLALGLLASGCASSGATGAAEPLATVDGHAISSDDLEMAFSSRHSGHLAFLVGESEVRAALEREIENRLLVQEAERLELGERSDIDGVVTAKVDRLAFEHLKKVEIEDPAQPTDEEIRAAWEAHTSELVEVRQIVVPSREEMDAIVALLAEGRSFEEVAREHSGVVSRRAGGLLPPIRWGQMEVGWDEVVFSLEPGEVSEPFASGGAWEIVQMVERKPVEQPGYDEAYSKIKGILLRRGLEAGREDLSRRLFEEYEAEIVLQPLDPAGYVDALAADPETTVASWQGGQISVRELSGADLDTLAEMNPERATYLLEAGIRDAVTERLMPLEVRRRGYTELPQIAAQGDKLRDDLMLAVLLGEFVYRDLEVSDEEIRDWYDANPDKVTTPERRRVAQLLVASEEEARSAEQRLEEGEAFAVLVEELSLDTQSSSKGGELGWITAEQTPLGWENVLTLEPGEIAEPLESDVGWHLIKVLEISPPEPLEFEAVKDAVKAEALKEKRARRKVEWLSQLREVTDVEISDKAIRAYVESSNRQGG